MTESAKPLASESDSAEAKDSLLDRGDASGGHVTRPLSLAEEIFARSGVNVARCYQCGKCSAGCPMGSEMRTRPHEVMHLVVRNRRADLLRSDGIWLCLTCETCSARCPNGADPARVIDTLREIACEADPALSPRTTAAFNRAFLGQVRTYGRVSEVGLAAEYNLRSGRLLQDATSMPGLLGRGKIDLTPHSIRGTAEVRRIFENVEALQRRASEDASS